MTIGIGMGAWFWMLGIASAICTLGLAALRWEWFREDAHKFYRSLSQEARHAEIVNAKPLPKARIQVEISNDPTNPIQIDRAEVDGKKLWAYYSNAGNATHHWVRIRWKGYAPDGTFVVSGSYSGAETIDVGDRGEFHYEYFDDDPRIVRVIFTADCSW